MLEFYFRFCRNCFKNKAKNLSLELARILELENIPLSKTDTLSISKEYLPILGHTLFFTLNELYFTIRVYGKNHFLLKKYLPENKKIPCKGLLFADFFCGAGGLSKGLVDSGFTPALVNDTYIGALETYYFNHELDLSRFFSCSIKELADNAQKHKEIFRDIKVIVGGPPCQGFSTANRWNFEFDETTQAKRFIDDDRNVLYKYFIKLLGIINPDFFIMENVRGMMRVQGEIEEDINTFTDGQYSLAPMILNACYYGIPQNRIRYLLIGGKNMFQIEQIKEAVEAQKTDTPQFVLQDALFGLPIIKTNPYERKTYFESDYNGYTIWQTDVPRNKYLNWITGPASRYIFNHRSRYNNDNDLEIFQVLPEGANSLHESIKDLNKYKNRSEIFHDKYYKLKQHEVSKTITSHMKHDCHMYIHPTQARGLSPREAARVQSFPDDYVFRGSLNEWYKQIGNAVPVKLGKIVADEIRVCYR